MVAMNEAAKERFPALRSAIDCFRFITAANALLSLALDCGLDIQRYRRQRLAILTAQDKATIRRFSSLGR